VKQIVTTLALAALVPVLAVAPGCAKKGKQAGAAFKMPPMPVETATVTQEEVADRFATVGSLEAVEQVTVVPEIDGSVVGLPFREGGRIAPGDVIAKLDDSQLKADADRAEAVVGQRQASFERIKTIVEQKAGSPQDLDDASAALKVAQADLALAKARLAKATIRAPFEGVVGARLVNVGQYLHAGDAITNLARLNELRVLFSVPERYLGTVKVGSPISVASQAFPGRSLEGAIDVISPVVDVTTRAANIVAKVANPEELLRPGMSADVTVVLTQRPSALVIPSEAIFAQGDKLFVDVIKPDSSVVATPVELGIRMPEKVEVVAGLTEGQQVVRTGHQKLFPGAKVMPIPSGGPGGPGGPGGAPGGPGGAQGGPGGGGQGGQGAGGQGEGGAGGQAGSSGGAAGASEGK
jgi:membrane fusion protein (multidrug efflux system)